jgi:polar amino acid transport system ATP-binding protein
MINVKNLCYTYGDGTTALHNINVEFPETHIFAIMGLSGSGKTTLLNCMARFLVPQKGTITLSGNDIYEMPEKEFRSQLGVVFQKLNLFPHMTVLENLCLAPEKVQKRSHKEVHTSALAMLDRLNIEDLSNSYPSQMSGGQAQRVAIARGLMLKPKVMLLDEPTSALDARTTEDFSQWLKELKLDTEFIIVTHDLAFAKKVAPKGMYMSDGEILSYGNIEEVLQHIHKS